MTEAQKATVELFKANAKEIGATIEVVEDEFGVKVIETASSEWDNEMHMWTIYPMGNAHLH